MKLASLAVTLTRTTRLANMYRIEVSPGEETVLRTIEELATAIRNGLVTPRSRIYHNASQKWLPIEFHPHYKKALATPDRPRPSPAAGAAALHPPSVPPAEPPPAPMPPPPASAAPARPVAPSRGAALPPVVASLPLIEVDLPEPDYPEMPLPGFRREPEIAVPGTMPVARRRASGGRPLLYAGSAVVLVVAGYLVTTAAPSSEVAAEPVPAVASKPAPPPAEPPAAEPEIQPDAEPAVATPTPAPEPRPAPAPRPAPPPVITSVAPRLGPASQAWSSSAGAITPPPAPVRSAPAQAAPAPAIAPAPSALDLSAASLEVAESLAPKAKAARDTGAIGRILKAVGAAKPQEPKPQQ